MTRFITSSISRIRCSLSAGASAYKYCINSRFISFTLSENGADPAAEPGTAKRPHEHTGPHQIFVRYFYRGLFGLKLFAVSALQPKTDGATMMPTAKNFKPENTISRRPNRQHKPKSEDIRTLFTILIAAFVCGCGKQPKANTFPSRWEYKFLDLDNINHQLEIQDRSTNADQLIKRLRTYKGTAGGFNWAEDEIRRSGEDGWELVAAIPQTETETGGDFPNVRTSHVVLIFKRLEK